jgi:hypothetical protein
MRGLHSCSKRRSSQTCTGLTVSPSILHATAPTHLNEDGKAPYGNRAWRSREARSIVVEGVLLEGSCSIMAIIVPCEAALPTQFAGGRRPPPGFRCSGIAPGQPNGSSVA